MKRVALIIAGICLAATLNLRAADDTTTTTKPPTRARRTLTDDQKKLMKEITEKYDTNKDGKLDKEERQKISTEDKEKMKKAGLGRGGRPAAKKDSDSTTTK